MAYNYYCTDCGRELNQDLVLFDMSQLLTATGSFNVLKFYMTKAELEALVAGGEKGDQDFSTCRLSFSAFCRYLSNAHNLANPTLAQLTMQDVWAYTKINLDLQTETPVSKTKDSLFDTDDSDDLFSQSEDESNNEGSAALAKEEKPTKSAAILALEAKDTTNQAKEKTTELLKHDFEYLNTAFGREDNDHDFVFSIRLLTEEDNDKHSVLIGYQAKNSITKQIFINKNARACPYCGASVFEHAGTAEHKTVAFIGDQGSGKTCTILALAHYAQNAIRKVQDDDPIWRGGSSIPAVKMVDFLSMDERLVRDLNDLYSVGLPPAKTSASKRNDAYSATFRLRNNVQDKYYILTFTDLPGELCNVDTEKIDGEKILNEFPVALACDTFVLCFDSTTAVGGKANKMVTTVCKWANEFQEFRQKYKEINESDPSQQKKDRYAPIMVLFTKCREIENAQGQNAAPEKDKNNFDLIKKTYCFKDERNAIERNSVYADVGSAIKEYDHLKSAYIARLRCSPYGFVAPRTDSLPDEAQKILAIQRKDRTEAQQQMLLAATEGLRKPEPINVDKLMRWLLIVSGCIPSDAAYQSRIGEAAEKTAFRPANNFVKRAQYRSMPPEGKTNEEIIQEALNRCYLFENPGRLDADYLQKFDRPWELVTSRLLARIRNN